MKAIFKKFLASQLIEYCDIKPLKTITVKDFTAHVGISKQTFYSYFKDKADLMNYTFQLAADDIISSMDTSIKSMHYGAVQMGYVCLKHKRFYIQMSEYKTQNNFNEYFLDTITTVYKQALINRGYMSDNDTFKNQVVRNFCVGITAYYTDWIKVGMKESPEYVADIVIASMPSEIKEALL